MPRAVFFIVYKGAKGLDLDDTPLSEAFAWAFGLGGGVALIVSVAIMPRIKKIVEAKYNDDGTARLVSRAGLA